MTSTKIMKDVGYRRLTTFWIRMFLALFVLSFICLQTTFGNRWWTYRDTDESKLPEEVIGTNQEYANEWNLIVIDPIINISVSAVDTEDLRQKIEEANNAQVVYNEDIYRPMGSDSVVLLVQVHQRIEYLKYLIESLSKARYIDRVLLIFSHDVYDKEMNELIRNITFCKVMQIFFPYSVQIHPNSFPGNDPRDCPRDIGKTRAMKTNCQNAKYPDKYGHYRESKYTQIKHHWWWKMNQVFNHINITRSYDGLVVFLEEDHYIVEDFIHMLRLMDEKCRYTANCHFLGLGMHEKSVPRRLKNTGVQMHSTQTNLGLAFNRKTYLSSILTCAKEFCEYDDYNWDWSLNYITSVCSQKQLLSMTPSDSRVFHIGACGVHVHQKYCDVNKVVATVQDTIRKIKLYPSAIEITDRKLQKLNFRANGGWGDRRDRELCLNMTKR